ncbi:MAG: 50S ribosomal protein L21 [Candidatus Kerfeldbacteria bacterium]|nr:50S ribosomal protein L21 [Candidatus Kerfeldbacteria bacterium]
MLAIIQTGGKQYVVRENQTIVVEKLPTQEGETVEFANVLLVSSEDGKTAKVGTPTVTGAKVTGTVLSQFKDKKINVVKFKSKVRYRRNVGHRQHKTRVQITTIS